MHEALYVIQWQDCPIHQDRTNMQINPSSTPLFSPGEEVQHVKTGGFYKIICLAKIEATLEDAYVYEAFSNGTFWVRPKTEMEDGRFVKLAK